MQNGGEEGDTGDGGREVMVVAQRSFLGEGDKVACFVTSLYTFFESINYFLIF